MKSVVVSHSNVYGGAEAYLNRLYARLAMMNVEPVLLGSIPGWKDEQLPHVDLPLSPKWANATILAGILRLRRERSIIRDAVAAELPTSMFHMQYKREQIGFTDILAKHGPVVWTEHGRFLRGPGGALLASAYRIASQKTAAIICVSQDVATDVRRVVGPKPRIEVIPNAIDTTAYRPATPSERLEARISLGLDSDTPVALWIGRLHRNKYPEIAVELASCDEWGGVVLLAGDGPEMDSIRQAGEGLPNLKILGHLDSVQSVFHAADVMLFTSAGSEGYPTTTMLESATFGVPMMTNQGSGAGKYVTAAGGVVLAEGSTGAAWAHAAHKLISSQMSGEARAWGEKHDLVEWTKAHEAIFKSVL